MKINSARKVKGLLKYSSYILCNQSSILFFLFIYNYFKIRDASLLWMSPLCGNHVNLLCVIPGTVHVLPDSTYGITSSPLNTLLNEHVI